MTGADQAAKKRRADPARLAAAQVLFAVYEHGAFANLSSRELLAEKDLDARQRSFAAALIYGTLSYSVTIDWLLARLSSRPLDRLDPWVRTVLRLGLWQLAWSHSVRPAAAIDESVRLVRLRHGSWAGGFVNAVLRNYQRQKPALPAGDEALATGMPAWLFGCLKKWYGPDEAGQLARQALEPQKTVTLRSNPLRTGRSALIEQISQATYKAWPGLYSDQAVKVELAGNPVTGLPGWAEGLFSVQDEAAQLVGLFSGIQAGWQAVDLCAAPGGKACHLAELAQNRASVLAVDIHAGRLELAAQQAKRLGLELDWLVADSATGQKEDGQAAFLHLLGRADLVLADVPCSALGLLARNPEIKLGLTYTDMQALYPLQAALLDQAARLLRPGGSLVYSTCTINPEENQMQAEAFLKRQEGCFRPKVLQDLPPGLLAQPDLARSARHGQLQLLPTRHGTDGFFIACFEKVDSNEKVLL